MFIFFFAAKEKTNQKKKPPPGINAIPTTLLPATLMHCVYKGGKFACVVRLRFFSLSPT